MTLSADIRHKLANTAAITAVIGTRSYPLRLPEGDTFPAVAYQVIEADPVQTMESYVLPMERLVQLSAFDTDYTRGEAAAIAIIDALVGRSTWDASVTTCRLAGFRPDVDPEPRGLYRWIIELYVMSPVL